MPDLTSKLNTRSDDFTKNAAAMQITDDVLQHCSIGVEDD